MAKKLKTDITPKKQKWNLFSTLPELKGPIIHICGNSEISVDGCRGVVDYYETVIKLRITDGFVTFSGNNLTITDFTESSAVIKGDLQNIEFSVK